jgi:hypothetical protein
MTLLNALKQRRKKKIIDTGPRHFKIFQGRKTKKKSVQAAKTTPTSF